MSGDNHVIKYFREGRRKRNDAEAVQRVPMLVPTMIIDLDTLFNVFLNEYGREARETESETRCVVTCDKKRRKLMSNHILRVLKFLTLRQRPSLQWVASHINEMAINKNEMKSIPQGTVKTAKMDAHSQVDKLDKSAKNQKEDFPRNIYSTSTSFNESNYCDLCKPSEEHLRRNIVDCRPTGVVLKRGKYGDVIELVNKESMHFVGKLFKPNHPKRFIDEVINVTVELKHFNIVACKGVCFLQDVLPVLVMEKLTTSLHAYLLRPDNSDLPVERKVSFLQDTARGLAYLHSRTPAIIHRDLTAKNVLLDSKLRAKISDFGNSRIMELDSDSSPGSMTTLPGTLYYMPPEALGGKNKYGCSLDIFSFGHLSLFTLIQTPMHLLPDSRAEQTVRSEVERREQFIGKAEYILSNTVFQSVLDLIKKCLNNQPTERPQSGAMVAELEELHSSVSKPSSTSRETSQSTTDESQEKVSLPVIRGADIIAQKTVKVVPDQSLYYHWKGHGFKLHIPAGAIRKPATLCIQASLRGQYKLPDDDGDDRVLLSGVYWLSLHPPVKKFDKNAIVIIQHSASNDDSLSFITAKCTQQTLPYTFNPLPGGSFSEPNFGTIKVNHFSALGIFGRGDKRYAFCTYYIQRATNVYEAHITVTPDIELQLQGVRNEYDGEQRGNSTSAKIKGDEVSLTISTLGTPRGVWNKDGWELSSLLPPAIQKERVDNYQRGRIVPYFSIGLRLKQISNSCALNQQVDFKGVEPATFVTLTREPNPAGGAAAEIEKLSLAPRLAELKILRLPTGEKFEIIKAVSAKWQDVGVLLDFDGIGQTLDQIEANEIDVESRCRAMFQHWLRGNGVRPTTWEKLLQILDDSNFINLAADIRNALSSN